MPMTLLERLFGRGAKSGTVAKDRLKFVLMHDRADIPAPVMDALRRDILAVLSKYVDIDETALEVELQRVNSDVALVANIPIRRVRTDLKTP